MKIEVFLAPTHHNNIWWCSLIFHSQSRYDVNHRSHQSRIPLVDIDSSVGLTENVLGDLSKFLHIPPNETILLLS